MGKALRDLVMPVDYKLALVTLLHDVGKILQRSGEKPKKVELGEGFYEHDELSYKFILDYLGEEYAEIFKKGEWKTADIASATERIPSEELEEVARTPLLDPLEDTVRKDDKVWYPVTYLELGATIQTYYETSFNEARSRINYPRILSVLKEMAIKASKIKDPKSLLETYDFIYRTVALFVPAAVYKAVPNTSLYGHSRLAAAFASFKDFRLLLIDIKGIQRFISNVSKEAESSKRFRGRSFFLQLLQQALIDKIAETLGLSEVNNLSFEPGKILFVVDKDVKQVVDDLLTKVSEWSDYELQFATSITSKPTPVSSLCFYCANSSGSTRFKDLLDEVFSNLKIVGRPTITKVGVDHFGDKSSRLYKVDDVEYIDTLAPGELESGETISLMNLISLIVGHFTRNLQYIVEVIYKEGEKGDNRVVKLNTGEKVGEIYIEPLNVGFFLISNVEKPESEIEAVVDIVKNKAERIKIFKVNDTTNFIPDNIDNLLSKFKKISFGYTIFNTYHVVDASGKFMSLDEIANYIALGKIDGDKIGEIVQKLSLYPSRLMTFSTLLNFAFTHVVTQFISQQQQTHKNIIFLYSGGDDVAVYGKWDEVLELLIGLSREIGNVLRKITVSGGLYVFKKKFPIYYAYAEASELESLAKAERGVGGRIASNIFEKYVKNVATVCQKNADYVSSLSWEEAEKLYELAKSLSKNEKIPSQYMHKLYEIGDMVEEGQCPRALVTYAYLNARNERTFDELNATATNVLGNSVPRYPGDKAEETLNFILKFRDVINMYSLMKRG